MFRGIRENLGLKLIALATSLVIWVFVTTTKAQPDVRRDIMAEVQGFGQAPADLIVTLHTDPIPVELVGPKSQVDSVDPATVKARVDLSSARLNSNGLRILNCTLPPGVSDVTVHPLRSTVTADITPKRRKRLPIEAYFTNDPPPGMRFGPPRLTPAWAEVVGAEDEVRRVARLVVYVETSGGAVRADVPIKPLDRNDVVIDNVQVEPATTRADVDLLNAPATKTLIVSANITGRPAPLFELRNVIIDPPRVTVTGPSSLLQTMTNAPTEDLLVDGLKADTVRSVPLQLPPGVTVQGGTDQVQVTIKVREIPRTGQ